MKLCMEKLIILTFLLLKLVLKKHYFANFYLNTTRAQKTC